MGWDVEDTGMQVRCWLIYRSAVGNPALYLDGEAQMSARIATWMESSALWSGQPSQWCDWCVPAVQREQFRGTGHSLTCDHRTLAALLHSGSTP